MRRAQQLILALVGGLVVALILVALTALAGLWPSESNGDVVIPNWFVLAAYVPGFALVWMAVGK